MVALGVFYAQQKPKAAARARRGARAPGQALWRGGDAASGVPACSACHGPTGAGIPKNFPRLAGQYADYTYAQLKAFGAGERGSDADGKDANGTHHGRRSRSGMSDAQMKAVAEYALGLR